jgi:microcystin-dependent protein
MRFNMKFLIALLLSFSLHAQVVPQGNSVPVGTTLEYLGSTAPTGYLLADGSCVSQTTYAKLYAMLGTTYGSSCGAGLFKLPDFRGMFLRGAGTNSVNQTANGNYYAGGTVGSYLSDTFQGHLHGLSALNLLGSGGNKYIYGGGSNDSTSGAVTDGTNGTPRTGNETRPASYSVNRIIKY